MVPRGGVLAQRERDVSDIYEGEREREREGGKNINLKYNLGESKVFHLQG